MKASLSIREDDLSIRENKPSIREEQLSNNDHLICSEDDLSVRRDELSIPCKKTTHLVIWFSTEIILEYVQITVTFLILSHNCETDLHISGSTTMHCENMVWFGFSCLSWESAGPAPLDYPDDTEMTDGLKAIQGPSCLLETADLNQPFSLPTSSSVTVTVKRHHGHNMYLYI